ALPFIAPQLGQIASFLLQLSCVRIRCILQVRHMGLQCIDAILRKPSTSLGVWTIERFSSPLILKPLLLAFGLLLFSQTPRSDVTKLSISRLLRLVLCVNFIERHRLCSSILTHFLFFTHPLCILFSLLLFFLHINKLVESVFKTYQVLFVVNGYRHYPFLSNSSVPIFNARS